MAEPWPSRQRGATSSRVAGNPGTLAGMPWNRWPDCRGIRTDSLARPAGGGFPHERDHEQQLSDIEALFVQNAASAMSDGATLTLKGMGASTIYFSDRPMGEGRVTTSGPFRRVLGRGREQLPGRPAQRGPLVYRRGTPAHRSRTPSAPPSNDPRLEGDTLTYSLHVDGRHGPGLHLGPSSYSSTPWAGLCRRGRWLASWTGVERRRR